MNECQGVHAIAADAAAALAGAPAVTSLIPGVELGPTVAALAALRARVDAAIVAVTAEAFSRGEVDASTAGGVAGWVHVHTDGFEPGEAGRIASVAVAIADPKNSLLAQAVTTARVGVRGAVVALRETAKVLPSVPVGASRDEVLGWFLQVADTATVKELRALSAWVVGRFAPHDLERDLERLRQVESLTWHEEPTGLWRFVADLAPDHAAAVIAAVSAAAKPCPSVDQDTGAAVRDPRTAGKRRADALVGLVEVAQRTDPSTSVTAASTVLVTIGLDVLEGRVAGTGSTLTGDVLDAGTIRRMACDADVIPAVLGGPSQILDIGRAHRFATPAIRAATALRDQGCTFPGCDRPPHWCDVHHIHHWADGGHTSLTNSALLCGRHHHIVHRDHYTAHVDDTGVRWHHPRHATHAA
jgi:hypothetical protein